MQTDTVPPGILPPVITSFAALAPRYDVVLCDVWGVLHNGVVAAAAASDALIRARAAGATVILVSNAPRPRDGVAKILDGFGVPRAAYDTIVTSGMVTNRLLARHAGARFWHLGPERDLGIYDGLDLTFAGLDEAELIVCTGLFDDTVETPEDYADRLKAARARNLPFICANPDIVVERGGDLIWCAGALAEAYAALGGDVVFCGKPHRPIYETALATARELRGAETPAGRVVAIGDALRTDLAGALGVGIDCLFVAAGIHAGELGLEHGAEVDPKALARLLADGPGQPAAVTTRLAW
ncbi:TIGR01459 family HAD-type hydrolase [Ancylobacter amanitiformis]|uniref:HAD superfamily hydrolase (TIGR01459 family) n=1 Tax=Ancylobacter amanitiformis TaxID=217069 RepID=A0ABU0LQR5_9HYPH|nr:TIGR01459 family HAD-type hydrolase [Ancylobacter amanitiformis]MDQ0511044.1 HAD superfamily hydrolase (TIGR01459 family) [Ancylobacter amanitiformis]